MVTGTEPDPALPAAGDFGTALVAMAVVVVVVVVLVLVSRLARRGAPGSPPVEPEVLLTRQERTSAAADRLRELQALRDAGDLTEAEYAEQRAAIVKDV